MSQIPISERALVPTNVMHVPNYYKTQAPTRTLAWPTSELYLDLLEEGRSAGFGYPWYHLISGYRDIATQQRLWDAHPTKDRSVIAPPGKSSHHTGHSMDIFVGAKPGFSPTSSSSTNVSFQRAQKGYQHFRDHIAPKYGLWQLPTEPWHWECDRDCRASYLEHKYGIPRELADEIASGAIDVPNGDLLAYIESENIETRAANEESQEGSAILSKVIIGTTLAALTVFGVYKFTSDS